MFLQKIYNGIIFSGKNNAGENTYQLNHKRYWEDFSLNEASIDAIKYLVGLGVSGKATLHHINENISGNMFETDESVENLCRASYLSKSVGSGVNSSTTFSLTEKGKRYAIKNGYHI
jgi:hypothetical protein